MLVLNPINSGNPINGSDPICSIWQYDIDTIRIVRSKPIGKYLYRPHLIGPVTLPGSQPVQLYSMCLY